MIYGYTRVSTSEQTTENQHIQIKDSGFAVDKIFSDVISGSVPAKERPAFAEMMSKVVKGDTVIVVMLDRIGRSAEDTLHNINQFQKLGVKLRIMQFDGVDVTSAMGKMIVTVVAALAEMEKNILIERTKAGMARTRAQGTKLGAPLKIAPHTLQEMVAERNQGISLAVIADKYKLDRKTVGRNIEKWGDKLPEYHQEFISREAQYAVAQSS